MKIKFHEIFQRGLEKIFTNFFLTFQSKISHRAHLYVQAGGSPGVIRSPWRSQKWTPTAKRQRPPSPSAAVLGETSRTR